MTEWKHYECYDSPYVPARNHDNPYNGYVYAVEYGNAIKIGSSTNPANRLKNLEATARLYSEKRLGSAMISPLHKNYRENERLLHNHFCDKRISSSELFEITLEEFKKQMPNLQYKEHDQNDKEKGERLVNSFVEMLIPNDSAQLLFRIIDSNPLQASEFYSLLSKFALTKSVSNDMSSVVEERKNILNKNAVTEEELRKARDLGSLFYDLLDGHEALTEEFLDEYKVYMEKYFKEIDYDAIEV